MKNSIGYFFSYFAEAIILWQYASSLFLPTGKDSKSELLASDDLGKKQAKKRVLILSCLYLFLFFVALAEIKWLNAVLFILVNFIYLLTQYRIRWFSALFHSAVLTAVMAMCELVLVAMLFRYSPFFFDELSYFRNFNILAASSKRCIFSLYIS